MLTISIPSQSLTLTKNHQTLFQAPVSTATKGCGFNAGSFCTPSGRFLIREKIGDGAPLFTTFRGRRPTGIWSPAQSCTDPILTRILWLHGLDPDNANTYHRFIYLHGTDQEDLIGSPASHGCIRLKNLDMLTLFNLTPILTPVTILP